ncbi:MAG: hypothetical protein EAZ61_05265 [Oscillatoriales cyanobacterium]|nr:MAG: hypothetical protein EAZ61_05265 [Oscillatoriales cyanobacterium]
MLNLTTAYLLVSHGSRDPRPQAAIADLAQRLSQALVCPVGWAILEFGQESLAVQIQQFAHTQRTVDQIYIVPLFLSSGVHVCDDIPAQIAIARSGLARETIVPEVRLAPFRRVSSTPGLITLPHLGNAIDFSRSVRERMQHYPDIDAWVTVAHGSRRMGGNAEVEAIATHLQREIPQPHRIAYWSRDGQLLEKIEELIALGHRTIGLLPHFLFPGKLTDGINATLQGLAKQFPDAMFVCLNTWGEAQEWTHNLVDWLKQETLSEQVAPYRHAPAKTL